jgi:beta-glucosidase
MTGVHTQLIKQLHSDNKKTVLLALTGGPISMNWEAENLPAIFVIWYGGQMMGTAITDVLVGDVSPAGRSPFTWPTGLSQVPDELDMSPSTPPGRTYRYLQPTPLYTFGYGLTYGRIQYTTASFLDPSSSKITIPLSCKAALPGSTTGAPGCGTITVCAQVTNAKAAAHATEEVVQVYAAPKQGSIHGASL